MLSPPYESVLGVGVTEIVVARPLARPTLRPIAVAFVVFGFFGGAWAAYWRAVFAGIAVIALVTAVIVHRARVPEPARAEHASMLRALAGLRNQGLLVLALVFAAAALVEGGIATWGVLYLREHLGLGMLVGVSAYVVGQILAALARIGGGPVVKALGGRRSIAIGGALAAGGIAAEALFGNVGVAAVGGSPWPRLGSP